MRIAESESTEFFRPGACYLGRFPRESLAENEAQLIVYRDACRHFIEHFEAYNADGRAAGFFVYFYDRGGLVVEPAVLAKDSDGRTRILYPERYENRRLAIEQMRECDCIKRLMHMSFNHVLADGRIAEFFFGEERHYAGSADNESMLRQCLDLRQALSEKQCLQLAAGPGYQKNALKI